MIEHFAQDYFATDYFASDYWNSEQGQVSQGGGFGALPGFFTRIDRTPRELVEEVVRKRVDKRIPASLLEDYTDRILRILEAEFELTRLKQMLLAAVMVEDDEPVSYGHIDAVDDANRVVFPVVDAVVDHTNDTVKVLLDSEAHDIEVIKHIVDRLAISLNPVESLSNKVKTTKSDAEIVHRLDALLTRKKAISVKTDISDGLFEDTLEIMRDNAEKLRIKRKKLTKLIRLFNDTT